MAMRILVGGNRTCSLLNLYIINQELTSQKCKDYQLIKEANSSSHKSQDQPNNKQCTDRLKFCWKNLLWDQSFHFIPQIMRWDMLVYVRKGWLYQDFVFSPFSLFYVVVNMDYGIVIMDHEELYCFKLYFSWKAVHGSIWTIFSSTLTKWFPKSINHKIDISKCIAISFTNVL